MTGMCLECFVSYYWGFVVLKDLNMPAVDFLELPFLKNELCFLSARACMCMCVCLCAFSYFLLFRFCKWMRGKILRYFLPHNSHNDMSSEEENGCKLQLHETCVELRDSQCSGANIQLHA